MQTEKPKTLNPSYSKPNDENSVMLFKTIVIRGSCLNTPFLHYKCIHYCRLKGKQAFRGALK